MSLGGVITALAAPAFQLLLSWAGNACAAAKPSASTIQRMKQSPFVHLAAELAPRGMYPSPRHIRAGCLPRLTSWARYRHTSWARYRHTSWARYRGAEFSCGLQGDGCYDNIRRAADHENPTPEEPAMNR